MPFMEQLTQRTQALACAGMARAKRLGAMARLKADTMARQDTVQRLYARLGKLWYSRNADRPKEPYTALCSRIRHQEEAIRANEERIKKIKEDTV